jgi:hypothetical protein
MDTHSLMVLYAKKTIPHKSPQEGIFLTIAIHKRKNISLFLQWKQEWYVNLILVELSNITV